MSPARKKGSKIRSNEDFQALHEVFSKIDVALAKDISLAELAFLSASSYFHFHRRFQAVAGEPVGKYVRRLVLERAAYELKISDKPVAEIAFEAGFLSHEAFTRAFRKVFSESPTRYRGKKRKTRHSHQQVLKVDLKYVIVPEFRIAYLRHRGGYKKFPGPKSSHALTRQLEQAALQLALHAPRWIGISLDDPEITPEDKIRFDLGIVLPQGQPQTGLPERTIAGGRYAVFRHRGPYETLPQVYDYLLNSETAQRVNKLRNEPPFESYVRRSDDETAITDIYLPIRA